MYLPSFVTLNGNVGQDPEQFGSGETVCCSFSMAVSQGKDKDPIWIQVTCFGRTADGVLEQVATGSPLLVTGRLVLDQWEKDGQIQKKIKLIADEVAIRCVGAGSGE